MCLCQTVAMHINQLHTFTMHLPLLILQNPCKQNVSVLIQAHICGTFVFFFFNDAKGTVEY